MSKPRNNNYTKSWDNKNKNSQPRQQENFFDYFKPGVEVRNNDVGKALRILKKRLERDDFQKTISKKMYHEKPSETRRRAKAQAAKRWQRSVTERELTGESVQYSTTGLKHLKTKKKMKKVRQQQDRLRQRMKKNT